MRSKFSICRRDNHALGVTLGRYMKGPRGYLSLEASAFQENIGHSICTDYNFIEEPSIFFFSVTSVDKLLSHAFFEFLSYLKIITIVHLQFHSLFLSF